VRVEQDGINQILVKVAGSFNGAKEGIFHLWKHISREYLLYDQYLSYGYGQQTYPISIFS
jgi:hypothetical protein